MSKRLTIPEVRQRLMQMALELADLVDELKRRPPVRKTRIKSQPMTYKLKNAIEITARLNPSWSFQRIANLHGVNPGRVSEILAGKR